MQCSSTQKVREHTAPGADSWPTAVSGRVPVRTHTLASLPPAPVNCCQHRCLRLSRHRWACTGHTCRRWYAVLLHEIISAAMLLICSAFRLRQTTDEVFLEASFFLHTKTLSNVLIYRSGGRLSENKK